MNTLRLDINKASFVVYPLVGTRAISVARMVCRGRRTWAVNDKGRVYCSGLGSIKRKHTWPAMSDVLMLSADDISALGMLGLIDKAASLKLQETEQYRRDYKHRLDWLTGDVENVRDAGIKLAPDWKARVEMQAHKYARAKQTKRRGADRARKAKAKQA